MRFQVEIWDSGYYGSARLTYEFDLTVYKACIDNVITTVYEPWDINYLLKADGWSTASTYTYNLIYSRGNVNGYASCLLSREVQIWEGAEFVTFDQSQYGWGYAYFNSGY